MSSKAYSLPQLQTFFGQIEQQTVDVLMNPNSVCNSQYFENFTTIALRLLKYMQNYLNQLNPAEAVGTLLDQIIANLNASLTEYRGRNVFASSCIISPLAHDQEQREQDEIYHFMNTRNNSIPLECLGNPDIDKQRIQLAEYVQNMEKKKNHTKQGKKSLQLPQDICHKLQLFRKTTFDVSLTPIEEEDGIPEKHFPAIAQLPVRHNQEAQTQTELPQDEKTSSGYACKLQEEDETTSQVCSIFVYDKQERPAESLVVEMKKGSIKRVDAKSSKRKKKQRAGDVAFFSRQGSKKGIKSPAEGGKSGKGSPSECSLKGIKGGQLCKDSLSVHNQYSLSLQSDYKSVLISEGAEQRGMQVRQISMSGQSQEINFLRQKSAQSKEISPFYDSEAFTENKEGLMDGAEKQNKNAIQVLTKLEQPGSSAKTVKAYQVQTDTQAGAVNAVPERRSTEIAESPDFAHSKLANKRLTILNFKMAASDTYNEQPSIHVSRKHVLRTTQLYKGIVTVPPPQDEEAAKLSPRGKPRQSSGKERGSPSVKARQSRSGGRRESQAVECLLGQGERLSSANSQHLEDDILPYQRSSNLPSKQPYNQVTKSHLKQQRSSLTALIPSENVGRKSRPFEHAEDASPFLGKRALQKQDKGHSKYNSFSNSSHEPLLKVKSTNERSFQKALPGKGDRQSLHKLDKLQHDQPGSQGKDRWNNQAIQEQGAERMGLVERGSQSEGIKAQGNVPGKVKHSSLMVPNLSKKGQAGSKAIDNSMEQTRSTLHLKSKSGQGKESQWGQRGSAEIDLCRQLGYRRRRELMSQYLDLIEVAHTRFCGSGCEHLSHLYAGQEGKATAQLARLMHKTKGDGQPK